MFLKSFGYAIEGIAKAVRIGQTLRIMLAVFAVIIAAGFLFAVSPLEWIALLTLCGGAFALEMVNTAIEQAVDFCSRESHPLAKMAKDMAAGAVLIWSLFSAAAGLIIFLPKLISLIG